MAIDPTMLGLGGIAALAGVALLVALIILLAVYVYSSWALMVIAKKTKTKMAWLAWIPLVNLYLVTQIARVPWWTLLILLLVWAPMIGPLIVMGLTIYWWWNIAEVRKMPGWLGILAAVPVANLVVMGYIAWAK
jgi:hypothetical protein